MFTLSVLIPLLTAGALAGFLAGLFGIGGGLLIVPIVLWLLETQHLGGMHIQHLAIGTSFAVMACTTFSGALAHARRRSVRWDIVCRMAPAMVGGALLGTFIAARIPAHYLQLFFVAFVCAIALQMLCRYRPQTGRHLPGTAGICLSGGVIGLLSSWVGIGGGTLSVPFMLRGDVPVHQAIGTSGALAWPMALSGAVGYLLAGWHVTDLPSGSLGYCYLPAAAVLALSTLCLAPVGVKIAHRLPDSALQRAFGLYLLIIAAHMLWKAHPHF